MKIKITCQIIKSDLEKSDFQMKISECDCVVCAIISKYLRSKVSYKDSFGAKILK